jgi:DNA-3-methyladenine glycosylase II
MKRRSCAQARGGLFDQMAVPLASASRGQPPAGASAGADYSGAMRLLSKADDALAELMLRIGPCRLEVEHHIQPFAALLEAIVHQQLNGRAAAAILKRVKALFPGRRFPRPEDFGEVSDERLRAAGLSRSKVAAIRDLAAKTQAGVVPTARAIGRMPDEEIVERLTAIRGIGRWTVEMLLLFNLGRPDVLPATDYGVRQGYALTFGGGELPKPAELLLRGERWRPHRSVATWYLWRAVEVARSRA